MGENTAVCESDKKDVHANHAIVASRFNAFWPRFWRAFREELFTRNLDFVNGRIRRQRGFLLQKNYMHLPQKNEFFTFILTMLKYRKKLRIVFIGLWITLKFNDQENALASFFSPAIFAANESRIWSICSQLEIISSWLELSIMFGIWNRRTKNLINIGPDFMLVRLSH